MSDEDLKAELERLRNENAALKKGASTGIRMKISEKGAISIYGMGRFPVTLYKEQWLKLPRYVGRNSGVYRGKRSAIEDKGIETAQPHHRRAPFGRINPSSVNASSVQQSQTAACSIS